MTLKRMGQMIWHQPNDDEMPTRGWDFEESEANHELANIEEKTKGEVEITG
jgi:hypothetical protein